MSIKKQLNKLLEMINDLLEEANSDLEKGNRRSFRENATTAVKALNRLLTLAER